MHNPLHPISFSHLHNHHHHHHLHNHHHRNHYHLHKNHQGLNLGAINAETDRRGFIPVNERMQVLDKSGKAVPNVWCIGDANGMLVGGWVIMRRMGDVCLVVL